jgi:hypothetical protein
MPETTGPQTREASSGLVTINSVQAINQRLPATYDTYRKIRKDPTVSLGRAMSMAPILAGTWSVGCDTDVPTEYVAAVQQKLCALREEFLQTSLEGGCDFGWQPFEVVWAYDEETKRNEVEKLKPLLHDITVILVEQAHGTFWGYRQQQLDLPGQNCLHVAFRVEGSNWYGAPLLENLRETQSWWNEANDGATRYDKKVAGSHWVVTYPNGVGKVNGVEKPNGIIAKEMLAALESSGSVCIPRGVQAQVEDLNTQENGWKVELLNAQAQQPAFTDRLNYLDKLKIRGLHIPERAVLEGMYGTKAEAGVHGDLEMTYQDLMHKFLTRVFNKQLVDRYVLMNFGRSWVGKIWVDAGNLVDENLAFKREVYKLVVGNPAGFVAEEPMIDTDALKDELGVPKIAAVAQAGEATSGVDGITPGEPATQDGIVRSAYANADAPVAAAAVNFNGAQVQAASQIVKDVVSGALPRSSGIGQLKAFFGLTQEQAEEVLGTAGTAAPVVANPGAPAV